METTSAQTMVKMETNFAKTMMKYGDELHRDAGEEGSRIPPNVNFAEIWKKLRRQSEKWR